MFPFKHHRSTRNFVVFFPSRELYLILASDFVTTKFVPVRIFWGCHMSFNRYAFRLSSFPTFKRSPLRSDCGLFCIPFDSCLHSIILCIQKACRDLYLFEELHVPIYSNAHFIGAPLWFRFCCEFVKFSESFFT